MIFFSISVGFFFTWCTQRWCCCSSSPSARTHEVRHEPGDIMQVLHKHQRTYIQAVFSAVQAACCTLASGWWYFYVHVLHVDVHTGSRRAEDPVDQPLCGGAEEWQVGPACAQADPRNLPAVSRGTFPFGNLSGNQIGVLFTSMTNLWVPFFVVAWSRLEYSFACWACGQDFCPPGTPNSFPISKLLQSQTVKCVMNSESHFTSDGSVFCQLFHRDMTHLGWLRKTRSSV